MVGVFALLFGFIPGGFFEAEMMSSSLGVDPEIAEYYALHNVTMYANTGAHNMTNPYTSLTDGPTPPDWELEISNHYFEVWWTDTYIQAGVPIDALQLRHVEAVWWGWSYHIMDLYYIDQINQLPYNTFFRETLSLTFDEDANASLFHSRCDHVSANVFLQFNQTKYGNITAAWDAGEIAYVLSYEYDWNQTNINAWTILGQLITFRSPSLGIPGIAGSIFNTMIAIPFWVMVAILIIKLVQSMIPLIKGTDD